MVKNEKPEDIDFQKLLKTIETMKKDIKNLKSQNEYLQEQIDAMQSDIQMCKNMIWIGTLCANYLVFNVIPIAVSHNWESVAVFMFISIC